MQLMGLPASEVSPGITTALKMDHIYPVTVLGFENYYGPYVLE